MPALPPPTYNDRDLVRIGKERVESVRPLPSSLSASDCSPDQRASCNPSQVSATDFPGHYPGESNHWDLDSFKQSVKVQLNSLSPSTLEFDLVGVDASVANAIRRIVIAEVRTVSSVSLSCRSPPSPQVPTVAIENVYVWNNTSIVQDEVLAQRLGLIPLAIDPRKVEAKKSTLLFPSPRLPRLSLTRTLLAQDEPPTDLNTVVFSLVARCERLRDVKKGETDPLRIWSGTEGTSTA